MSKFIISIEIDENTLREADKVAVAMAEDVQGVVARVAQVEEAEEEERMWVVRVPITVTADDRDEAIKFALDDLRDPTMEWDYFEVQQISGPHPRVAHGKCPVCGHYGADCTGQ